eukprot:2075672-Pyramimonas_sp.AAC.1
MSPENCGLRTARTPPGQTFGCAELAGNKGGFLTPICVTPHHRRPDPSGPGWPPAWPEDLSLIHI